jgi:hypothetical protein
VCRKTRAKGSNNKKSIARGWRPGGTAPWFPHQDILLFNQNIPECIFQHCLFQEVRVKEKEAHVDFEKHQLLLYVEKDDGTYGALQTGAFGTKNYVDDFWVKRKHLEKQCLERLCKGEISPVAYYMLLNNIAAADLALRSRTSVSNVKKHMQPAHFAKIGLPLLKRYADVFGVPLANMFQVVVQNPEGSITFSKTDNPLVVTVKVVRENPAADGRSSKGEARA